MTHKELFYPETKFGGFSDIDGTMAFFNRVTSLLELSFTVLDVGCGRGDYGDDPIAIRRNLRIIKGKVGKVIGIDVNAAAKDNPFVDEFRLIIGDSWPIDASSIDLILCDCVLEHIENPDRFFSEVSRVLKNAGCICLRTSNRWSYIGFIAAIIPNKYHSKITSLVQDGRKVQDVFPTFYNCNSIGRIRNALKGHCIDSVVYGYEAEPDYLSFSKLIYSAGILYQRIVPGFLKSAIFAFGKIEKKPD